jgi:preprotein translocase subunit SecY
MGGQSTYIPMRLNAAGVIPIIFAVSIMILPQTLIGSFPEVLWLQAIGAWFNPAVWQGLLVSTLLIIAFTYFYTQISFDPRRISENLREYGGFVPGVRPGQPTTEHLTRITSASRSGARSSSAPSTPCRRRWRGSPARGSSRSCSPASAC